VSKNKYKSIILFRKTIYPLKPILFTCGNQKFRGTPFRKGWYAPNQQEAFLTFGGVGTRKININGSVYSHLVITFTSSISLNLNSNFNSF